jgi:hypothetical protein
MKGAQEKFGNLHATSEEHLLLATTKLQEEYREARRNVTIHECMQLGTMKKL